MSWMKNKGSFALLTLFGFLVLVFSIFDIVYDKGWFVVIISLYVILIILIIVALVIKFEGKSKKIAYTVEEFEKSLKGGLFHFKCPTCSGVFAIKKSKSNDNQTVKMTCPDCGAIGFIPPNPFCIEEEIPEKKSIKANFKCTSCGEGVTVWAEGTKLYKDMNVYSCPFCGEKKPLDKF